MKSGSEPRDDEIVKLLKAMKSAPRAYPPELLSRRREAFLTQLNALNESNVEDSQPQQEEIVEILKDLKPVKVKYPSNWLARRRAAFLKEIDKWNHAGWLEILRARIKHSFLFTTKTPLMSLAQATRRPLLLTGILAAVLAGMMIYLNRVPLRGPFMAQTHPSTDQASQSVSTPSVASRVANIVCSPTVVSPLCITKGFVQSKDLTSWVSSMPNSSINIDAGQTALINQVEFERRRLRGSSGQFMIAVALSNNLSSTGDSIISGDGYQQVYDSKFSDFAGTVSGPETVQVVLKSVLARFVKITVSDPGTVINQVRVVAVIQPATATPAQMAGNTKGQQPSSSGLSGVNASPIPVFPIIPTNTPSPSNTPTTIPTLTPLPTNTSTPLPTATLLPTDTPTPLPTATSLPTSTPVPTDTLAPTAAPVDIGPSATSAPQSADTSSNPADSSPTPSGP